jgi:hypothetical protein
MTHEQAQSIGQIIDRFDFQTVHDYMVLTGWKWFDEVPTMDNLKGTATRLLVEAQMDPQEVVSMGTGGFRVYKLPWGLELVFAMKRSGTF